MAERQVVALKTDHLGVPYDKDATTEDFIVELCKQKELLLNSGKDQNFLFFLCFSKYLQCCQYRQREKGKGNLIRLLPMQALGRNSELASLQVSLKKQSDQDKVIPSPSDIFKRFICLVEEVL